MKNPGEMWLGHAEVDLKTIEKIIEESDLTPAVAFHSQQCIEKCFKAILEAEGVDVPRTHSLILLYALVRDLTPMHIDGDVLSMVNETYISTRYPTDIDAMELTVPSVRTAGLFFGLARSVFEEAREYLRNLGERQSCD